MTRSILARGDVPARVGRPLVDAVMREGLGGWVFRERAAALIADTREDARWHFLPGDKLVPRSVMAARCALPSHHHERGRQLLAA